jgi:GNAT superfamily N-acetyltransferase
VVTIQVETWAAIQEEIEQITPFHWSELALDQLLFAPDLDHERYLTLDRMGMMHIVTARDGAKLVGYIVCFVMPHLHYKSSGLTALADMYYILREYRKGGLGVRMFAEMERGLKARGVIRAHMSCKVHDDHTVMFERMGWALTDFTFSKLLLKGGS